MRHLKKTGVFLVIFAFVFQSISLPISAMTSEEQFIMDDIQMATILADENEEDIPLYEEDSEDSEVLTFLQSDDKVAVLEKSEVFSFVEFIKDDNKEVVLQGFILNVFLNFNEEKILDDIQTATIQSDDEVDVPLYEENSEDSEILTLLQSNDEVVVLEKAVDFSFVEYVENDEEVWQGFIHNHFLEFDSDNISEELTNAPSEEAINDAEDEQFSKELSQELDDSFNHDNLNDNDHIISETNEDIPDTDDPETDEDGPQTDDPKTIEDDSDKDNHNDQVDTNQKLNQSTAKMNLSMKASSSHTSLVGIALEKQTSVYAETSPNSKSLKSYPAGSILKYSIDPNLKDWYTTGVYINGVKHVGYIHKSHVENVHKNQVLLEGIGLKDTTSVYTRASTSSEPQKSYPVGSVLKYYTYSENWYKTSVYINGKKQTGYIHKTHVENAMENQVLLEGIALKDSTPVYTRASTSSGTKKSYPAGSILKYYTYSNDWYKTGVYVNGKKQTGYIHKSHVENSTTNPKLHEGIAKNITSVYVNASTKSGALKNYPAGSILKYYTYSKDWYRTGVYINGKKQTGYIHKSDVENAISNPVYKKGIAVNQPTTVFSNASTSSKALKSYSTGQILVYYTYSKDWYRTGVYINGIKHTGYIHKSHVAERIESNYNISLSEATNIQVNANGQTDKNYKTYVHKSYIRNHKVTANKLNVRSGPSTNEWVVGQLKKDDEVTILNTSGDWYEIEFTKNHQWVNAHPEDIKYYLDPNNFINDPVQRFQFLDLSKASGASVASLNSYLENKGILKGHGKTFQIAGITHNVNEAYLLSHALLETGNGSSRLATGIQVGLNTSGKPTLVAKNNKANLRAIKTVYNMYGIGAKDKCPEECGAIEAYKKGWTTPEKAIVGGAEFIGEKYIHGKNNANTVQNTLYKMRWNPEYMERTNTAGHQYATDIGWASKQVSRISSIYKDLKNDFIILDVPTYK